MTWKEPCNKKEVVPGDGSQSRLVEEAIEVLEKAVKAEGDTAFLWTGGKEAQVIADLLLYDVGDPGEQPVPFVVLDTGNHFDEMYDFREEYAAADGDEGADTVGPFFGLDEVVVERYDEFLENIIRNESDPRDYHGEHSGVWRCPECGEVAELEKSEYEIDCSECGEDSKLHEVQRQNLNPEEWGVPESCGSLKVVPLKRVIQERGFDNLITGVRSTDPLANTGSHQVEKIAERSEPADHTRYNPLKKWAEENVYAYLKAESVKLPSLYTEQGFRH
ncbi:MAG: phosphoadenosine phosphosulfate reductase family protein, partial [Candidatus Nanohaloarchaea archaeon]